MNNIEICQVTAADAATWTRARLDAEIKGLTSCMRESWPLLIEADKQTLLKELRALAREARIRATLAFEAKAV